MNPRHRTERIWQLGAGLVLIALAMAMGAVIAAGGDPVGGLDTSWMADVVGLRIGGLLFAAMLLNHLGGGWLAILVIPIGSAAWFLFARRPWSALAFVLASAVSAGLCQLAKALFGRARPHDILLPLDNGSFPSGHATNAAVIAVLLGLLLQRTWVWVVGAVYLAAMALSRTLLGAHWVTDTVGGALLGAGTALVVVALLRAKLDAEPVGAHPGAPRGAGAQRSGSASRSRTA